MDSRNRHMQDHLGVNKIGKNIRKSPLHQPNFGQTNNNPSLNNNNNTAAAARPQPQPQVYNISKSDFRDVVQRLTGSPSHDPLPRPPTNQPKSQSMRLQKIRPPPLTPMNRPHMPPRAPAPMGPPPPVPYNNNFQRPPPPPNNAQYAQPLPGQMNHPHPHPHPPPPDPYMNITNESPISQYMRYLQTSITDPSPMGNPTMHPSNFPQGMMAQFQPHGPPGPAPGLLPSPRFNGPMPPGPPPPNGPPLLPSPTAQFLLPSPTGYLNLLSPRSPYPLLSPGSQFPPLTPSFSFSPLAQMGILGPGPPPPPSPGLGFPLSPSFFAMPSPRWRDQ